MATLKRGGENSPKVPCAPISPFIHELVRNIFFLCEMRNTTKKVFCVFCLKTFFPLIMFQFYAAATVVCVCVCLWTFLWISRDRVASKALKGVWKHCIDTFWVFAWMYSPLRVLCLFGSLGFVDFLSVLLFVQPHEKWKKWIPQRTIENGKNCSLKQFTSFMSIGIIKRPSHRSLLLEGI